MTALENLLSWPEHHIGLAWWIAIAVSSPFWVIGVYRLAKQWSTTYRLLQIDVEIRAIEKVRGDIYQLVVFLVRELVEYAFTLCWSCAFALLITEVLPDKAITLRSVVQAVCLLFVAAVLTFGSHVRTVVGALIHYEYQMPKLKAKQAVLRAKIDASQKRPQIEG